MPMQMQYDSQPNQCDIVFWLLIPYAILSPCYKTFERRILLDLITFFGKPFSVGCDVVTVLEIKES
jgi:hypothetical protein